MLIHSIGHSTRSIREFIALLEAHEIRALTETFKNAASKLIDLAGEKKAAYMCAEKFYWRCHRRLISDYLLTQGHAVCHIIERDKIQKHELTEFARMTDGRLTYPLPLFNSQ